MGEPGTYTRFNRDRRSDRKRFALSPAILFRNDARIQVTAGNFNGESSRLFFNRNCLRDFRKISIHQPGVEIFHSIRFLRRVYHFLHVFLRESSDVKDRKLYSIFCIYRGQCIRWNRLRTRWSLDWKVILRTSTDFLSSFFFEFVGVPTAFFRKEYL